jgi:hypothetical protein
MVNSMCPLRCKVTELEDENVLMKRKTLEVKNSSPRKVTGIRRELVQGKESSRRGEEERQRNSG